MLLAGITGVAAGPGGREGRGPRPRARCRALFRRRRWQWRRPFSPYVAIKCEARSPTRWLAGWLAPFLSLFLEFPLLSRIGGRYLARRAREGGSRALTRDGDLFRLQETFRSLVRESDSRSTSFRPSFRLCAAPPPSRETTRFVAARSVYAAAAPAASLFVPTVAWLTMQTRRGREHGNGVAEEATATEESNYTSSSSSPQAMPSSHSPFSGPLLAFFPSPPG